MLSKLTSLNAMQIEISLLQHMISISTRSMFPAPAPTRPADFDILYLNPPTNQINLPQLIRSHKKPLNPPTITLFP